MVAAVIRLALIALLCVVWASPAHATASLVASASAAKAGGSDATTGAVDTTGANLIVIVVVRYQLVSSCSVSDSKGNTWVPLTTRSDGNDRMTVEPFYAYNPTVGSGHTFTWDSCVDYASILVLAFSGISASPFDQENGGATGAGTTAQPGSITPTQDDELVIQALGLDNNATPSISSITDSYTHVSGIYQVPGTGFGGAIAWKQQSSAAATNPTWTVSSSTNNFVAVAASFKATGGGGGGATCRGGLLLLGVGGC